jgi:ABC-2 type transport system ATP-binding protein
VLVVSDLHVRFGDVVALDGLSLEVRAGARVGFVGPNGAGKTTTMRTILGIVRPQAGAVHWCGAPIDAAVRRRIGYMPEERGLYARMTAGDQVRYLARLAGLSRVEAREACDRWLDRLGLAERADARIQDLSHGNQQRVQLAAALVHDPDILVLDEPFSGLDPVAVHSMTAIIAERAAAGAAVLFSSHQLDLVQDLCDEVVVVDKGRVLAAGPVAELRAGLPVRVLVIEFEAPVAAAFHLDDLDATYLVRGDRRVVAHVPADVDPATIAARASAIGTLRSFSFEPPRLDDVFRSLVQR